MRNIPLADCPYEALELLDGTNPSTLSAHGDMLAIELALDNLGFNEISTEEI